MSHHMRAHTHECVWVSHLHAGRCSAGRWGRTFSKRDVGNVQQLLFPGEQRTNKVNLLMFLTTKMFQILSKVIRPHLRTQCTFTGIWLGWCTVLPLFKWMDKGHLIRLFPLWSSHYKYTFSVLILKHDPGRWFAYVRVATSCSSIGPNHSITIYLLLRISPVLWQQDCIIFLHPTVFTHQ